MSNHSVIEHRANYHYIRIEEDFLAICSRGECSPHCKALILAILEHWTNSKRDKDESEYIYLTMPEWAKHTYMLYERNVLTDCIKELIEDKLVERRAIKRYDQDTFEYKLNLNKVNALIKGLPEKAIKETQPNLTPYLTFKDRARARRAKNKEGVGEKSRTSKSTKRVREKSPTVGEKSRTVREKSPQHSIPTEITNITSISRSTASESETEENNDNDSLISKSSLEEEKAIWASICSAKGVKRNPTHKEKGQITELAELIHSNDFPIEEFTASFISEMWQHALDTKTYLRADPNWKVGNIITEFPEYAASRQEPQEIAPPSNVEGDTGQTVIWTRTPTATVCSDPLKYSFMFEEMSLREAIVLHYDDGEYGFIKPQEEEAIRQILATQEG